MPRSIPFAPKLIAHHLGGICEVWVLQLFQNHDFSFFTPPTTKSQNQAKTTSPNLVSTTHIKINSCCSQTFPISLWRYLKGYSPSSFQKAWFFVFLPTHQQITKSSQNTNITKHGLAPTIPRSIRFAPNLFPHHLGGICKVWLQPDFKNHDFRFSPHTPPSHKIKPKHKNHQTWLYTNHTNINTFCSQTFPTSLCRHLWGLRPTTFPKTWFSFFTPHSTKSQNKTKTPKSPNLAIHQPCQDQFLLLPNFSHITLEAFLRFESNHISKTLIFVFHPTHHQVIKSGQNTKITKIGYARTTPRSFAPKLFPRHFGGICEVWVQPHFQKHDFRFSPHTPPSHKIKPKPQNHQTWLCTNHAKIISFCLQTFPTSL